MPARRPPVRVACSRERHAGGRCCTTQRSNAHVTVARKVLYPWHPWYGLTVQVHEAFDKGETGYFRCSLDGGMTGRWLELPAWMFDSAACLPVRMEDLPQVDRAALDELKTLLAEVQAPQSSNPPVSGARGESSPENRRDANATPTPPSRRSSARSQSVGSVPPDGPGASLAPVAGGDARDGDEPDGATSRRPCAAPLRSRTSDGRTPR